MDLGQRYSKIRETQLKMIIDYGATMDFRKESFIEPAESCPH